MGLAPFVGLKLRSWWHSFEDEDMGVTGTFSAQAFLPCIYCSCCHCFSVVDMAGAKLVSLAIFCFFFLFSLPILYLSLNTSYVCRQSSPHPLGLSSSNAPIMMRMVELSPSSALVVFSQYTLAAEAASSSHGCSLLNVAFTATTGAKLKNQLEKRNIQTTSTSVFHHLVDRGLSAS